jgi:hypothetical protein
LTLFADTNATGAGPFFYRVRAQQEDRVLLRGVVSLCGCGRAAERIPVRMDMFLPLRGGNVPRSARAKRHWGQYPGAPS